MAAKAVPPDHPLARELAAIAEKQARIARRKAIRQADREFPKFMAYRQREERRLKWLRPARVLDKDGSLPPPEPDDGGAAS